MIDYDGEGEVDFKKFCLINTDKSGDVKRLIEQMKQRLQLQRDKIIQEEVEEKQQYLINMGNKNARHKGIMKKPPLQKDDHRHNSSQQQKKPVPFATDIEKFLASEVE